MRTSVSKIRTAAVGVSAVAVLASGTTTIASAQDTAPRDRGADTLTLKTSVGAAKAKRQYSRTQGTVSDMFSITHWRRGKVIGFMEGKVTQKQNLNAKSLKWKRSVLFDPYGASGTLAKGATVKVYIGNCKKSGCSGSKAQTKRLKIGPKTRYTFSIKSPKKTAVAHKPTVIMKATVKGRSDSDPLAKMRTVRCDNKFKFPAGRGKWKKNPGCVYPDSPGKFHLSRGSKKHGEAARHVYDAMRKIKGNPGWKKPLHRITDRNTIKKHRAAMCGKAKPKPGYDCDEYPMAATREGGNPKRGSTRMIHRSQNRSAGASQAAFYRNNRMFSGDSFYMKIK